MTEERITRFKGQKTHLNLSFIVMSLKWSRLSRASLFGKNSSAFFTCMECRALSNGAQSGSPSLTHKKRDVEKIMTTREEKLVITFTKTRSKVDWEVLCYLKCDCLGGIMT